MHLFEKTTSSTEIYKGRIFNVLHDTVELENGAAADREVVVHSGGVCVIPVMDDGSILFVRQFRYAFKEVLLEIPAGKLEIGEDHCACGKRELLEETGAMAAEFIYLGEVYPTTAYLTERIHMYLAKGLSFTAQNLDADEFLDVTKLSLDDAVRMVLSGEIKDSKTQIGILKAKLLL